MALGADSTASRKSWSPGLGEVIETQYSDFARSVQWSAPAYLKASRMGVCGVEINVDLDADEKTGGTAWENRKLGGFEFPHRVPTGGRKLRVVVRETHAMALAKDIFLP